MGVSIAKIEDQETWVVYQSSTNSMFAPMFDSNLKAEMFATIYHKFRFEISHYTETAQMTLASELSLFVEEMMPKGGKYDDPQIPKEWQKEILEAKGMDEDVSEMCYDYDDLMSDVEQSWKSRRVNVLEMLIVWFDQWHAKRKVKSAKTS